MDEQDTTAMDGLPAGITPAARALVLGPLGRPLRKVLGGIVAQILIGEFARKTASPN